MQCDIRDEQLLLLIIENHLDF